MIKLKEIFPEYSFDWIILGKKPITVSDRAPIAVDDVFNPIGTFDVKAELSQDKMEDVIDGVVGETALPEVGTKVVALGASNKVKQIVYVYEDDTFEIYTMRR